MKVLAICVPYDGGKSGISVYVRNVVRELQRGGCELTLAVEKDAAAEFPDSPQLVLPGCCSHPVVSMLYCLFVLPFRIKKNAFDRIVFLAGNRRLGWFRRGYTLAVIHDLSQYHIPVKYDCFRMFYIKHLLPRCLRRGADVAVAISRSTADDLERFWRTPPGRIMVDYNGIDRSALPLGENDAGGNTVLYVSRIESPGKNHAGLIRAWELLPEELTKKYTLVLAGSDWSGAEEVRRLAENSPRRDSIRFTGFISRAELREQYRHCSLYVSPSFFEGFGLTLVEAMASGAVCACSDNSSQGEIAGDAALTFDPGEPREIAAAIERGLTDVGLRRTLRERGLRRSAEFDWARHVAGLLGEFEGFGEVFGCRFSTGTMGQALDRIAAAVGDASGRTRFFAFVNADCLNRYFVDAEYVAALKYADAVWPDGVGVALAAKYLGTPVRENVNGTDMLPLLCGRGYKMYLLGGAPGVAEAARERLCSQYPSARIVGVRHGYFDATENGAVLRSIADSGAEILFVAFGAPRQEEWIARNLSRLTCRAAIGVGGLLDFASGRIPRAPRWLRAVRCEWMFRLYQEPRRLFRRYVLGNPLFVFRVLFLGKSGVSREQNSKTGLF